MARDSGAGVHGRLVASTVRKATAIVHLLLLVCAVLTPSTAVLGDEFNDDVMVGETESDGSNNNRLQEETLLDNQAVVTSTPSARATGSTILRDKSDLPDTKNVSTANVTAPTRESTAVDVIKTSTKINEQTNSTRIVQQTQGNVTTLAIAIEDAETDNITRMTTDKFVSDPNLIGLSRYSVTSSPPIAVENIAFETTKLNSKAEEETEGNSREDHTTRSLTTQLLSDSHSNLTNIVSVGPPLTPVYDDGRDFGTENITLTNRTTLEPLTTQLLSDSHSNLTNIVSVGPPLTPVYDDGHDFGTENITLTNRTTLVPLTTQLLSDSKSNLTNIVSVGPPLTPVYDDGRDFGTENITLTNRTTLVPLKSRFQDDTALIKSATPDNKTGVYGYANNVTDTTRLHFQTDSRVTEVVIPGASMTRLNDTSTEVMTSQSGNDVVSTGRNSAHGDEQRMEAAGSFNLTTVKHGDDQLHRDSAARPDEPDYTTSSKMAVQLQSGVTVVITTTHVVEVPSSVRSSMPVPMIPVAMTTISVPPTLDTIVSKMQSTTTDNAVDGIAMTIWLAAAVCIGLAGLVFILGIYGSRCYQQWKTKGYRSLDKDLGF